MACLSAYAQVNLVNTGGTYLKTTGSLYLVAEDLHNEGTLSAEAATIRLTGDLYNTGTFNNGIGTLIMNGTSDQELNHNGVLYNLAINSEGQVRLVKSITVEKHIDFGKGNLVTATDNQVTLAEEAMLLNETADSYLKGNVSMTTNINGTSSGFGNIGTTLDAGAQNLGNVTVTRTAGLSQQGVSYGVSPANADIKSIDRIYTIEAENEPTSEVNLTFTWNAADNNGNTDLSEMQVWHEQDDEWTGTGEYEEGVDYEVSGTVISLGRFSIGPDLAALFQALFQADSVCFGEETYFKDLSSTFGSNVTYQWDLDGDGAVDNVKDDDITFTYSSPGIKEAMLVVSNADGKIDTLTMQVPVFELPEVDAGADMELTMGESTSLQPFVSADVVSYQWSPQNYLDDATAAEPVATPLADITYMLTVANAEGCMATDDISITLKELFIPTGFTPDGDGTNDLWEIPALENFSEAAIRVYDRGGRLVFSGGPGNFWDGRYNGSKSPAGTYFYMIDLGNGMEMLRGEVSIITVN